MELGLKTSVSIVLISIFGICTDSSILEVTYDEPKQTCPYFYDNRNATPIHGLVNCSWYSQKACCKRTEVTSVFSNMYPLYEATKTCANMMNYLMCYFCSPEQYIWYKQQKAQVCSEFCLTLHEECKGASYNGVQLGHKYENGSTFCEAQDFQVVEGNCFKFDPKVFDGAEKHISYFLPLASSFIMVVIAHFI